MLTVAAHELSQGAISALQGGSFLQEASTGAVSSLIGGITASTDNVALVTTGIEFFFKSFLINMDINIAIRIFARFLNCSWDIIKPLLPNRHYSSSDDASMADWVQANWEILVEKKILLPDEYLGFYGDGADFLDIVAG